MTDQITASLLEHVVRMIAEQFDPLAAKAPAFDENQRELYDLRYSRKDAEGRPSETPPATIIRVSLNAAAPNALYGGNRGGTPALVDKLGVPFPFQTAVRKYNHLLEQGKMDSSFEELMAGNALVWLEQAKRYQDELITPLIFLPNSPTWTGAGTPLGQYAACFVLPLDDDLGKGRGSIFETLKVAALIQQTGGGLGFPLYFLRPKNSLVERSMGRASGPLGFLGVYDAAFGEIGQGGTRRGANMGVMLVSHPDIYDFLTIKNEEGKIKNFNLSVAITDEFMEAFKAGGKFLLRWGSNGVTDDPVNYKITREADAADLGQKIFENAWINGEPGNLFIDRANRDNPVPKRYRLHATNPCGEQWLGPYENCCLGSISVNRFADWGEAKTAFDWGAFRKAIVLSTQFLDDVVDANQYVDVVPELAEAAEGGRRIGLGPMGIADAMVKLRIRYGSPEGLEFASQLMEFMRYHTMLASIDRAKQRGPFGWIEDSIYDPKLLLELGAGAEYSGIMLDGETPFTANLWAPPSPLVKHKTDFGRPALDWDVVLEGIKQHGIRNSCQLTVAPTGTISNVAGLEGSGCEPFFALAYVRTVMQEGEDIKLDYLSGHFEEALVRAGVSEVTRTQILKVVKNNGGTCQGVELVPESVQNVVVTASDITPEEHVWTQAVLQRFVDNSISKTINMPNSATVEDVKTAYLLAYELGCKGITVYRKGSREREVLASPGDKAGSGFTWPLAAPLPLPAYAKSTGLPSSEVKIDTPFGGVWLTITELREAPGRPFDVRIRIGKAGNDKHADVEAIGRMASLLLRVGLPVEQIVEQLNGIGGESVQGYGPNKIRSAADGIAKVLERLYMGVEDTEVTDTPIVVPVLPAHIAEVPDGKTVCKDCKRASALLRADGCLRCEKRLGGCGWSECK